MAVSKMVLNTALILEVSGGVNDAGKEVWRRKSFQGIKNEAIPQDIFDVATAIVGILGGATRSFHLQQKVVFNQSEA